MSNETVLIYQIRDVIQRLDINAIEGFMSLPDHVQKLLLESCIEQLLENPTSRFINVNFVDDFNSNQLNILQNLGDRLKPILYAIQITSIDKLRVNNHRMHVSSCGIDKVGGQFGIKVEELNYGQNN